MDDGFQFARKLVLGGGFLAHEAEGAFESIAAACAVGGLVAAAALKVVESLQADDFPEHFLALGGGLVGELVGAALNEEGAVDEGVVVHADDAVYLELGLTDAVAGYGMKAGGAFQLKLEVAAAGAAKAADDAVVGVGGLELQIDVHVGASVVQEVAVAATPGLAPEGPGYGVEEGGLSVAVSTAKAGDADAGEVQGGDVVAVAEEILEG